jgi:hypothetical protein
MFKIQKGISGGQIGVDRVFLDFCIQHKIPHSGWCPFNRRAEDGRIPDCYQLKETSSDKYPARTRMNVIDSDATLIFNRHKKISPGCKLTVRCCEEAHRPYLLLDCQNVSADVDKIEDWLRQIKPQTLNVAGNRETTTPGICP